jgi:hypothetical protein
VIAAHEWLFGSNRRPSLKDRAAFESFCDCDDFFSGPELGKRTGSRPASSSSQTSRT